MNQTFAEYTKLSAFQITLSKRQAEVLLSIWEGDPDWKYSHFITTVGCLIAKGLVYHIPPTEERPIKHDSQHYFTTRAGSLVAELLIEAGWRNEGYTTD